jgi:glycosyltransferase involved in cell wall biosynthesis
LELAALDVDVLHCPDFIPPARLGRRWRRVITIHDLAFLRFPDLLTEPSRRYYRQIGRAVAEAEQIIAVSRATRDDLVENVDRQCASRVSVIGEAADACFVPGDGEAASRYVRHTFGIDRPYYLFVGTREPRKNLRRLLEAYRSFDDRLRAGLSRLVLVGSRGWLDEAIETAISDLGNRCIVLGWVSQSDLVQLYRAARALLLVSLYEGFGLPALEAMACGCPTIVSNVSSLPEIVGDAGILVDPSDGDSIASALTELWDDSVKRQRLSERGLRQASQFSWQTTGENTIDVYRRAAACGS